jgi:F-type H+-transporting ATPase subunit alpha
LKPLAVEKEIIILYAALNGYFDNSPKSTIKEMQDRLIEYMSDLHENVLSPIREKGELDAATEEKLKKALSDFDFTK